MYIGPPDWDPIEPSEIDIFTIEITTDLQAIETGGIPRTCAAVIWNCSVARTDAGAVVDPSPQNCLVENGYVTTETDAITGALRTFVSQQAGNMTTGNLYALEAVCTLSDGSVLRRHSRVYCKSAV